MTELSDLLEIDQTTGAREVPAKVHRLIAAQTSSGWTGWEYAVFFGIKYQQYT